MLIFIVIVSYFDIVSDVPLLCIIEVMIESFTRAVSQFSAIVSLV